MEFLPPQETLQQTKLKIDAFLPVGYDSDLEWRYWLPGTMMRDTNVAWGALKLESRGPPIERAYFMQVFKISGGCHLPGCSLTLQLF
jgi:hypothetical protein